MLKHFHQRHGARRFRRGWTLVEFLVASAAGLVVMSSLMTVIGFSMRNFKAAGNYGELNQASRFALDNINRDARSAAAVFSYTAGTNALITAITFTNNDTSTINYTYDSTAGTLTRVKSLGATSSTRVLLTGCDALVFSIYKGVPGNNLTFSPATTPAEVKMVYVDWKCSRTIDNAKENTESVQTAQIAIRN